MRSHALLLLGSLSLGCSEQHGTHGRATPHGSDEDAGETDETEGHAEPAEPHEPDIGEILDGFFAGLKAFTKASCACLVESGEFATESECFATINNVVSWRDCAGRGLAEIDLSKVRRQLGCQADDFYMRAECLNALSCSADEERAACQSVSQGCPSLDEEIVIALGDACTVVPPSYEGDTD